MTAAFFILTATVGSVSPGNAAQPVEIRLRGHYFAAPANVIVNVAIEPAAANYRLLVEADSEKFFRSSEIELAGESDKRVHTLQFTNLPEGEYTLRAELRSRSDILGKASQGLTVMGAGGK